MKKVTQKKLENIHKDIDLARSIGAENLQQALFDYFMKLGVEHSSEACVILHAIAMQTHFCYQAERKISRILK